MRSNSTRVPLAASILIVVLTAMSPSAVFAQVRVTSHEELRRELAPGDVLTIVPAIGPPVSGRLIRVGDPGLDLSVLDKGRPQQVTLPWKDLRSLERRRDSTRNGALLGAGVGGAVGGALFVYALAIDRNDMDEWASLYAKATAVCIGAGAAIGWSVDAARSKPHIRFDAPFLGTSRVSVHPVSSRGGGIGLAVSLSR